MPELKSDELYGVAKKINRELEDLPLHQHSAVVELVRVGMQVRAIGFERAEKEQQMAQRDRQLQLQEQQLKLAQAAAERAQADEANAALADPGKLKLVTQ